MENTEGKLDSQLKKLLSSLQLGPILGDPKPLCGGFLHQTIEVETKAGKYAIKVLNQKVMAEPGAIQNFKRSERIAAIAAAVIPALPAKCIHGKSLHLVDGQFFQVFDYVEGCSKKPHQITLDDCSKMGRILATLHQTDFSEVGLQSNPRAVASQGSWQCYLDQAIKQQPPWLSAFQDLFANLYQWDVASTREVQALSAHQIISHGDMDPKNVLWQGDNPILIDWEFAGHVNPLQELVETAIYWSEDENHVLLKDRAMVFFRAYTEVTGPLTADWKQALVSGFSGKLSWLQYNLNRALGLNGDGLEERQTGLEQVEEMLIRLKHYGQRLEEIESWFK